MFLNEEEGEGEVSSFGALCTALSATIGTGKHCWCSYRPLVVQHLEQSWWSRCIILDVGCGIFWNWQQSTQKDFCSKIQNIDKEGHVLGGPFYYIESGMGHKWKWLAKIFAFFGACVWFIWYRNYLHR